MAIVSPIYFFGLIYYAVRKRPIEDWGEESGFFALLRQASFFPVEVQQGFHMPGIQKLYQYLSSIVLPHNLDSFLVLPNFPHES